ncbi:MAG TPA: adenosylhomocysteinase, partial [Pyrodictiaceae archaeon]|nr:adenosylhomocysteinase [Pyrodictiaceae archaeon]
ANAGHLNVEIWIPDLESLAVSKRKIRPHVVEYKLRNGKRLYLLAEGRLVNLVAAEGHPSEVMDMSFANQALAVRYLVENKNRLKPGLYNVPPEIDVEVAKLKLKAMGIKIDELTEEQRRYLESWKLD